MPKVTSTSVPCLSNLQLQYGCPVGRGVQGHRRDWGVLEGGETSEGLETPLEGPEPVPLPRSSHQGTERRRHRNGAREGQGQLRTEQERHRGLGQEVLTLCLLKASLTRSLTCPRREPFCVWCPAEHGWHVGDGGDGAFTLTITGQALWERPRVTQCEGLEAWPVWL